MQPERALSQSFVGSLGIPCGARCQGESFGLKVPGCVDRNVERVLEVDVGAWPVDRTSVSHWR